MMGKGLFVLLVLAIAAVSSGQPEEKNVSVHPEPPPSSSTTVSPTTPKTPPTTSTTPPPTTPTTPPPTPPTTPPTTPTTPPTTPTTPPPTTSTSTTSPKTTTPPPNTTTSSTTAPTTPTTTIAPTTTVAPPVPQPEIGKWTVQNKTGNIVCIIADMAVQLNVTLQDSQNKTYILVDVPKNATANGTCGLKEQVLNLTWPTVGNKTNKLIVSFEKNDTAKEFSVLFNVTFWILEGKNVTELKLRSIKPEFTTPDEMSYRCIKSQNVNLTTGGSNETVAYLTISNTQFEAFHNKTDKNFSAAKDCESSGSPDIVPIAVGCALVGLVAIVLIAYLIGRRRSQARGYLSIDGTDSEDRR